MNLLDLLLGLIVVLSIATGFAGGFARVGIGFCAAVIGVLGGLWFYATPAAWFHKFIHSEMLSNVLGFTVVFWAVLLAGTIVGAMVSKIFRMTGLSWLDRLLGAAFGLVRGVVIGVAFVAVLLAFSPRPLPNWMVGSALLPYAVDASDLFASLAPADLKQAFRNSVEEIRKDWEEELKKTRKRGPEKRELPDAKRTAKKQYV